MNSVPFYSHHSIFILMNLNGIVFDRYFDVSHENAFQLLGTDPHIIKEHANDFNCKYHNF